MNEIFDIRRFGALAVKFYRENMKTNLIFMAVMAVVTFLFVCGFNPFLIEYSQATDADMQATLLAKYKNMYATVFWVLFGCFSVFVASRAFRVLMSRLRAASVLLLPASSFEKYLLVVLHSTVVLLVVHLAIFYGTATIASSYKYAIVEEMNFEGETSLFRNRILAPSPGKEIMYSEVGNVFSATDKELSDNIFPERTYHSNDNWHMSDCLRWNLMIILWTFIVGVFMWGSITFRKRSVLLTVLVHALAFLLIGWLTYLFVEEFMKNMWDYPTELYRVSFLFRITNHYPSSWWLALLYIFPLTYWSIIWYKFKNKQV